MNGIGGENERPSANRPRLGRAARLGMLPTPLAQSARQVGGRNNSKSGNTLTEVARAMLPTPTSTEFKRANSDAQRHGVRGGRRLTAEAAKISLPTPTATDSKRGALTTAHPMRGEGQTLTEALSPPPDRTMYPTPWASDATKGARSIPQREGKQGPTLVEAINMLRQRGKLPTPTATDARAGGTAGNWTKESGRHAGATLTDVVVRGVDTPSRGPISATTPNSPSPPSLNRGSPTGIGGGLLNPAFVEWMMGWPAGWMETYKPDARPTAKRRTPTSSTSAVTVSSHTPQLSLFASSGSAYTAIPSPISEPKMPTPLEPITSLDDVRCAEPFGLTELVDLRDRLRLGFPAAVIDVHRPPRGQVQVTITSEAGTVARSYTVAIAESNR